MFAQLLQPRPGAVVLFIAPGHDANLVEVGLVTSIWRGVKAPRLYSGETPLNSIFAFRVLQLEIVLKDGDESAEDPTDWEVGPCSFAWTVRLESMVAVMDVESSAWARSFVGAVIDHDIVPSPSITIHQPLMIFYPFQKYSRNLCSRVLSGANVQLPFVKPMFKNVTTKSFAHSSASQVNFRPSLAGVF